MLAKFQEEEKNELPTDFTLLYDSCDIVGVGTDLYVGCWFDPHNGGSGNILEDTIAGSRNDVTFSCYTTCDSVGGNT
jgi:hypothetical protein